MLDGKMKTNVRDGVSRPTEHKETIGDRVRFREALRRLSGNETPSTGNIDEPVSTIRRTRERLFQPYNVNRTRRKSRKVQDGNIGRSWTATFICLADKDSQRVPNSKEKILLQNSGLGLKKISFRTTDTEDDVSMKLQSEITGFPKLKESGGFELLSCVSNCRNLEVLKCHWNVGSLKSALSAQTKIYIRPIQKNLKIDPEVNLPRSINLKEKCIQCNEEIDVAQLREHRLTCSISLQQPACKSDSDDMLQFTNSSLGQMSATSVPLHGDNPGWQTSHGQPATVSSQMSATSVPLHGDNSSQPTSHGQPATATVSSQMSATSVPLPIDNSSQPTSHGQPATVSSQMSATSVPLPVDNSSQPTSHGQPATVSSQMSATSVPLPVDNSSQPTSHGQPATVSSQMSATSVPLHGDNSSQPTSHGQPATATVSSQMSATSVPLPVDNSSQPTSHGQPATVSSQMSATSVPVDGNTENDLPDLDEKELTGISVREVVKQAIQHCVFEDIANPVEILKYMQSIIVTGRRLEVDDISQCNEGLTNFILVDRSNILETAFDEIRTIKDLRPTLEVQFYDEVAVDYGGPRKEFFRLVLTAIKEKYFDYGLREHLAEDYITVGKIIALSILQNGKLPKFMEENIVTDLFSHDSLNASKCIKMLRQGLDDLGIYQIGSQLPSFVFLLRPGSECTLTMKALTHLLKPKFSDEGSNSRRFEGIVYAAFTRYVREAASGRRGGVSLKQILQFVTGADEEPVLGFALCPSIQFCVVDTSFIPTANTCINCLNLPRPTSETSLPADENLFSLYDYAFQNTFYGMF
ncbi:hypothetical protein ScPMuIL_013528 [Solemya velum]